MKKCFYLFMVMTWVLAAGTVKAQADSAEKQVIQAMNDAAEQWNKGDLDSYMALYDTSTTMMLPQGRIKIK
jgi:hypothetical protein